MQNRTESDAIDAIKNYGSVLKALSLKQELAKELVEHVARTLDEEDVADSIVRELVEDPGDLSDGAFIGLQDALYREGVEGNSGADILVEQGVDTATAEGFYFRVVAQCTSFLSGGQNERYQMDIVIEEVENAMVQEAEEEGDDEFVFYPPDVAFSTAKRLMVIFQDMLADKGGILAYQALVGRMSALVDEIE